MRENINVKQKFKTYQLDNDQCCEIELVLATCDLNKTTRMYTSLYYVYYKSKDHSYKKRIEITGNNIAAVSIEALSNVINSIDGIVYNNVTIFYNNDYIVKLVSDLSNLVRKGKVDKMVNKTAVMALYRLMQTIGSRYYITVRKEKIIKVYTDKCVHE